MKNDIFVQKITSCAFLYKDNTLFIARRALTKKFLPGRYELPGGHVEFGETMEEGLKREMKEEFNVDIHVHEPFYAFTYISEDNTKHTIEVIYFATLLDQGKDPELNPKDHSEFHWITREEISNYFLIDDEEVKAIKRGFAILLKD